MQVTVEQRVTHHVSAKGSYTWSHTLASSNLDGTSLNNIFLDYNYPHLEKKQRSDQDRRNMVSASVVWKPDYFGSFDRPVRTRLEWLDVDLVHRLEQRPALHRNNWRGQLLQRPGEQSSQHCPRRDSHDAQRAPPALPRKINGSIHRPIVLPED